MAKILVVDDAAFMRLTFKKIAEAQGHTVVGEAGTGMEAIEKFDELRPDLIIMDITMPGMNGIDALRRIKEIDSKAKVIICSALGQVDKITESIEAGAQEFVVKPFEAIHLERAINKLLS